MTTKFEKSTANTGVLTFEIPVEDVKKGLDVAFKKVQKRVAVPGFRKGKVPRQVFNNVYGEGALYEEALNYLLPTALSTAVKEAELELVAEPKIDIQSLEKGQPWVLTAEVTLKPEVKLGEYKNLTVEKQDRTISDEDVKAELESRRARLAELVVKESAAELGDTTVIDFEGFLGEEAFEGGKGENYSLELGSGSFIPGFEDQLVGVKAGDEVEVKVTFPETYHAENLAGQEATFNVKVHEVKAKEMPELDDEFAKDADEEVETLAELENKIRVQLEESKVAAAKEIVEDLALRQAVGNAEIVDLPQVMIEEEINRQVSHFLNNLKRQGINEDLYFQITGSNPEALRAQYAEEAELRTKTNLVLEAIVKAEALTVTDSEIEAEVADLAKQYNMDPEQVKRFVTGDMLTSDIKMKKAMSLIVDTAVEK
ncbi:trigger factor [Aerococcaceae bacterium NML210727]|nr:trigger factor [Aerococcaceae bacterium NML210727]MCW6654063.1 trigger factor [Aerococcaceae bacterium NML201296]MCW6661400.1 trigger factor [Aerococcaceae bacterium NML201209]MCW6664977.1 trigger factor [Aerococcaceae bacterium NML191219]